MNFIVRYRPGAVASIHLHNPETFTELSVIADSGLSAAELDAVLDRLAESHDGTHAYIAQSTIREAAMELGEQTEWNTAFARMVEFAQAHGWVDDVGNIRAHIQHR